jgi:hypothetical protein
MKRCDWANRRGSKRVKSRHLTKAQINLIPAGVEPHYEVKQRVIEV